MGNTLNFVTILFSGNWNLASIPYPFLLVLLSHYHDDFDFKKARKILFRKKQAANCYRRDYFRLYTSSSINLRFTNQYRAYAAISIQCSLKERQAQSYKLIFSAVVADYSFCAANICSGRYHGVICHCETVAKLWKDLASQLEEETSERIALHLKWVYV